jgi:hypothetical protein
MKQTFGWILFFLAAGLVITAGIYSGTKHNDCRECKLAIGQKNTLMACHEMHWKKKL